MDCVPTPLHQKRNGSSPETRVIDGCFSVAINLIKFGCLAVAFICSYWMADSLTGKQTFANIGINMLFDSRVLGIIFGTSGII